MLHAFATFVCSWIGIVCHFYFLCTISPQETFGPFKLVSFQDLNERDDEAPNALRGVRGTISTYMNDQNDKSNLGNVV